MKIGKMRHIIRLQNPGYTVNPGGTPITAWQPFITLRAEKLSGALSETVSDAGAEDRTVVRFRTRHIPGVKADMRLKFEGDDFNIKGLQVSGDDQFLEIEAVKVGG